MKKHLTELFNSNYFFLALLLFALVLPLSQGLVSVCAGLLLFVALFEGSWQSKLNRLRKRKILLLVPIIFLIYLIGTLVGLKNDPSFYDVKKTMFYLVIPLAFSLGKEINSIQKRAVILTLMFSVLIAMLVALIKWLTQKGQGNFSVHDVSLISHIRFSFQLALVFWAAIFLLYSNLKNTSARNLSTFGILAVVYLGFMFFQQSLTGIVALAGSLLFFIGYLVSKAGRKWVIPASVVLVLLALPPVIFLNKAYKSFYGVERPSEDSLEKHTENGNLYRHDLNDPMLENGNFVGLYLCETEMREAWNKRAETRYDSTGVNGYILSSTLIRYLTSKNLRKDAAGVNALAEKDIKNIESGMANFVYEKKYSLYPRIYQTVWEYYVFSKTGYSNHQSFSQRIEFARAALTIIRQHPWLGVGPGNWKEHFAEAFRANRSNLDESLYASSHNQYLNYMVKFGIVGFLLIMVLLVYPVVKTRRYHDPYFMVFLIFMLLANLADSNLESHMGSSFFFFFYCFFLTGPESYLKLESQPNKKHG